MLAPLGSSVPLSLSQSARDHLVVLMGAVRAEDWFLLGVALSWEVDTQDFWNHGMPYLPGSIKIDGA